MDLELPDPWISANEVGLRRDAYPTYGLTIDLLRQFPTWLRARGLLLDFEPHPLVSQWVDQLTLLQDRESNSGPDLDLPRIAWAFVQRAGHEARALPAVKNQLTEFREGTRGTSEKVLLALSFIPVDLLSRLSALRKIQVEDRRSPEVQGFRRAMQNPRTRGTESYWQPVLDRFEHSYGRPPTEAEWAELRRRDFEPAFTRTEERRFFADLGLDHHFPSSVSAFSLWAIVFIPLYAYLERFFNSDRPGPVWYASAFVAARYPELWDHTESARQKVQHLLRSSPSSWSARSQAWQQARQAKRLPYLPPSNDDVSLTL